MFADPGDSVTALLEVCFAQYGGINSYLLCNRPFWPFRPLFILV